MSPWARWSTYGKPPSVEDSRLLRRKKKRFGLVWDTRKLNCFPQTGFSSTRPAPRLIWGAIGKGYALDGRPTCYARTVSRAPC
jgi:hypothetical protein